MVFPTTDAKDLRIADMKNATELETIIKLRFANRNTKDTLKIYQVNQKSLKEFSQVDKKGQVILPPDQFRLKSEEFAGSDETGIIPEMPSNDDDLQLNRFSIAEISKKAPDT